MIEYLERVYAADPLTFGILLMVVGFAGLYSTITFARWYFRKDIEEYKKKHNRL